RALQGPGYRLVGLLEDERHARLATAVDHRPQPVEVGGCRRAVTARDCAGGDGRGVPGADRSRGRRLHDRKTAGAAVEAEELLCRVAAVRKLAPAELAPDRNGLPLTKLARHG